MQLARWNRFGGSSSGWYIAKKVSVDAFSNFDFLGKGKGLMALGRPSTYKPEYCEKFIEIMENEGFIETFCAEVGIHTDTYYDWIKKHEDFAVAVKKGRNIAKRKFLDRMHNAAWDSETHKVNNGLIALLASNCHGMYTKKDPEGAGEEEKPEPMKIEIIVKNSD